MFSEEINIPVQKISNAVLERKGISLYMKRDDLIHEEISGNKWRKLKYNLLKARQQQKSLVITLGGAFSNHIAATAAAGREFGIQTKGIIRGEEIKSINPTLLKAKENGMELEFVSREYYRERNEDWFKKEVLERHDNAYYLPEGGANYLGLQGCTEILNEVNIDFDFVCTSAGTGTTASGIGLSLVGKQKLLVFPALKGGAFLQEDIAKQLYWATLNDDMVSDVMSKIIFHNDYHFGGYAKINFELIQFMRDFYSENKIKLDPVYSAKMVFGIYDLIAKRSL